MIHVTFLWMCVSAVFAAYTAQRAEQDKGKWVMLSEWFAMMTILFGGFWEAAIVVALYERFM